jgi:UDP-N-acetylmuramoyl-tripeptide--D-alanyl-D-alanine ligase
MAIKMKLSWSTGDILNATGGRLRYGPADATFATVGIDSRRIAAGELFVAIVGAHHDGHAFAAEVVQKGVRGLLIASAGTEGLEHAAFQATGVTCIETDDTARALGDLAAFNRQRAPIQVVALTGSSGKTTTRRMTTAVVGRYFETLATIGNFNNEIGLPLSLLNLQEQHRLAVLELGMNHPGEIRRLGRICRPDIAMVTNVGPVHLEGVGSIEGVVRAKREILESVAAGGRVVLNADDARVTAMAGQTDRPILRYGLGTDAQVRASDLIESKTGSRFTLNLPDRQQCPVSLKVPGRYMVSNALAAAAVGYLLGLSAQEIRDGLSDFQPAQGRMQRLSTRRGIHIIDDTYNANPDSMAAAISSLNTLRGDARGILVAGEMLELGTETERLHHQLGTRAARAGIDLLLATGRFAQTVAEGAKVGGMIPDQVLVGDKPALVTALKAHLRPGDWVLVKGSRGMAMETVVADLRQWADASE